jgi:hypothetical protein
MVSAENCDQCHRYGGQCREPLDRAIAYLPIWHTLPMCSHERKACPAPLFLAQIGAIRGVSFALYQLARGSRMEKNGSFADVSLQSGV